MTTIIVKNMDFSGGRIAHYTPPVSGASLCAFVGDKTDADYLRNFGTGSDLEPHGVHASIDAGFRRFSLINYLQSSFARTENTTILAVCRQVTAAKNGIVMSSERDIATGGRRGLSLAARGTAEAKPYILAGGSSDTNTTSSLLLTLTEASTAPSFLVGTAKPRPNSAAGTAVSVARLSVPIQSMETSYGNATLAITSDEAGYPMRVGRGYLELSAIGDVDIGFIAAYDRILTTTEQAQMLQSVRRRFASLGITI